MEYEGISARALAERVSDSVAEHAGHGWFIAFSCIVVRRVDPGEHRGGGGDSLIRFFPISLSDVDRIAGGDFSIAVHSDELKSGERACGRAIASGPTDQSAG